MSSFLLLSLLFQGTALGLTAAISPGPFQAYLISESLQSGWKKSYAIAFAPLISDAPIITLMLVLLNQFPPVILRAISVAGGLFVLYLAWGLWKAWRAGAGTEVDGSRLERRSGGLWKGVLMNVLSPGPYTFWGLVNGPILLGALHSSWFHGGAFLFGFYSVLVGGLLGIALLFSQAQRLGGRVVRALLLASIVILVIFGEILIWRGFHL